MVRFMSGGRRQLTSPLIHIRAKGGAPMSQVQQAGLQEVISQFPPKVIFAQAGINDLSKSYLFISKHHHISSTLEQLNNLKCLLKALM